MKKNLALLTLAGLLFAGCATTPQDRMTTPVSVVKIATFNGTYLALRENPHLRDQFREVANQLRVLELQPHIDAVDVIQLIQTLPVKELQTDTAQVMIANASLLIGEFGGNTMDVSAEPMRPFVIALREGIERRIGPPGDL